MCEARELSVVCDRLQLLSTQPRARHTCCLSGERGGGVYVCTGVFVI